MKRQPLSGRAVGRQPTPDELVELPRIQVVAAGEVRRHRLEGYEVVEVLPAAEILSRIDSEFPLEPIESGYPGEVARRYRYRDGAGEIGVIASVTRPFCSTCTRLRISSDGRLFTCLFGTRSDDLRERLRRGDGDEEVRQFIAGIWQQREDRYSELRSSETPSGPKVEMSQIGG